MRSTVDQKSASVNRRQARAMKYNVVSYDVHGYTIDTHETTTWDNAVDYARNLRDVNPLYCLSDIDPIDDNEGCC